MQNFCRQEAAPTGTSRCLHVASWDENLLVLIRHRQTGRNSKKPQTGKKDERGLRAEEMVMGERVCLERRGNHPSSL